MSCKQTINNIIKVLSACIQFVAMDTKSSQLYWSSKMERSLNVPNCPYKVVRLTAGLLQKIGRPFSLYKQLHFPTSSGYFRLSSDWITSLSFKKYRTSLDNLNILNIVFLLHDCVYTKPWSDCPTGAVVKRSPITVATRVRRLGHQVGQVGFLRVLSHTETTRLCDCHVVTKSGRWVSHGYSPIQRPHDCEIVMWSPSRAGGFPPGTLRDHTNANI